MNYDARSITEHIGKCCKEYRMHVLNVSQKVVADETQYARENVSKFESGKNDNVRIFLWYVSKGLLEVYPLDYLIGD